MKHLMNSKFWELHFIPVNSRLNHDLCNKIKLVIESCKCFIARNVCILLLLEKLSILCFCNMLCLKIGGSFICVITWLEINS